MTYRPFFVEGADRTGGWLVICDHATNTVPDFVGGGDLGLPAADMQRHIAYDIGALGVSRALAAALDAPLVWSNFSRLVIDPNRGLDDPTLLMRLYDGTIIPANAAMDAEMRAHRLDACYHPYHAAIAEHAACPGRAIVSVHSFTPQLQARPPRPWQVGILSAPADRRLADPLLEELARDTTLRVGDNEPYTGHLPGDSIDRHALAHRRPNALLEIRQDLIADAAGQVAWGGRFAPVLEAARRKANL